MNKIVEIDLRGNLFKKLFSFNFQGLRLVFLNLDFQLIGSLETDCFCPLELEFLSLRWNQLAEIHSGHLRCLSKIYSVNLEHNRIKTLYSMTLVNNPEITSLFLNDNLIESIESFAFKGLSRLYELQLLGNRIRYIGVNAFVDSRLIPALNLSAQALEHIEPGAFNGLTKMESLDLQWNYLSNVTFETFNGTRSLTDLNLSYNRIRQVERTLLRNMTKLQNLFLRNTSLSIIKSYAFNNLKSLKCVHLLLNRIDTIEEGAFQGITSRVVFQIERVYPPPITSNTSLTSLIRELCYLRQSSNIFVKRSIGKVVYYQSMNLVITKDDWDQFSLESMNNRTSRFQSRVDEDCSFRIFLMRFSRNFIPGIETEFEYIKFIELCYQAKLNSHEYMTCLD